MEQIIEAALAAIEEGDDVRNTEFTGDTLEGIDTGDLCFVKCVFKNVTFGENHIKHLSFADCTFKNCDLSGLRITDGSVHRSKFTECRGTGAVIDDSAIMNVVFENCMLNYLTVSGCKINSLRFKGCSLARMMLHTCRPKGLKMENCDLTQAEFVQTPLAGVDLSTDDISGIRVPVEALRGAKISVMQSVQVCALLGVEIV